MQLVFSLSRSLARSRVCYFTVAHSELNHVFTIARAGTHYYCYCNSSKQHLCRKWLQSSSLDFIFQLDHYKLAKNVFNNNNRKKWWKKITEHFCFFFSTKVRISNCENDSNKIFLFLNKNIQILFFLLLLFLSKKLQLNAIFPQIQKFSNKFHKFIYPADSGFVYLQLINKFLNLNLCTSIVNEWNDTHRESRSRTTFLLQLSLLTNGIIVSI